MPRHIKQAALAGTQEEADAEIRSTVETIIADVAKRGDAAVRELSASASTNGRRRAFASREDEIAALVAKVAPQTIDDIKFAQAQIRNFAEIQRASLKDVEVETLPGVVLGHRHIPVGSVGCYVPGGRYPMVASAHMSIVTARSPGSGTSPPARRRTRAARTPRRSRRCIWAAPTRSTCWAASRRWRRWRSAPTTFKPVDMLVGPGNAYVAEAKRQLYGQVGIDLFAGPTEILVIADETADAEMCATDLLGPGRARPDLAGDPADHLGEARARNDRRDRPAADRIADRRRRRGGVARLW